MGSRPSRRSVEALRILESEALIKVQRGNVGGAMVQYRRSRRPPELQRSSCRLRKYRLRDIYEARLSSNPAPPAGDRKSPTTQTIAQLQELLDDGDTPA